MKMSNVGGRSSSKMKATSSRSDQKRLKPIFPKLPILSNNISNARQCFACDVPIYGQCVLLTQNCTTSTNTSLPNKIGQLVGDRFMVVVSHDDVICRKCYFLLNQADQLETDLLKTQRILRGHLYKKYNISEPACSKDNSEQSATYESNSAVLQVVESGSERKKSSHGSYYRPIVPKPEEKPQNHQCTMCDLVFDSFKLLKDHKMSVHLSTWTCHFCNALFDAEIEYTEHIKSHLKDATYSCQMCTNTYATKEELINHIGTTHKKPDDSNSKDAEKEKTETGDSVYNCKICSVDFLQLDVYYEHMQNHDALNDMELESFGKTDGLRLDVFEGTPDLLDFFELNILYDGETASERFICCECGSQLSAMDEMREHMQTVHGGLKFPMVTETDPSGEASNLPAKKESSEENDSLELKLSCKLCGALASDEQSLDAHVQECQGTKTPTLLCCPTCGAIASSKEDLLIHSETCGNENEQKETQEQNVDIFTNDGQSNASEIGVQVVDGKKARAFTCMTCADVFASKAELSQHEKDYPDHFVIHCPDCDLKFTKEKALNEHRDVAHEIAHCRYCNKEINNLKQMKAHEARHVRSARKNFDCKECGKIFQTPGGLRIHSAEHTGNFSYSCEFCGKGFASRVRAIEHRASHTKEERYTCEICDLKFSFQATYWIHKKWHENPRPYKCDDCGRLFKHSSLLSVHRRKHTGERPYQCQYCDQSFPVGSTLKRHMPLHTGVFPYTCTICSVGFLAKHKLATHMSKVHQDNQLIKEQLVRKAASHKMIVKEVKATPAAEPTDETWILAEEQNDSGQYLALKIEDGERILLTEGMLEEQGDSQLVEIILKDDGDRPEGQCLVSTA